MDTDTGLRVDLVRSLRGDLTEGVLTYVLVCADGQTRVRLTHV